MFCETCIRSELAHRDECPCCKRGVYKVSVINNDSFSKLAAVKNVEELAKQWDAMKMDLFLRIVTTSLAFAMIALVCAYERFGNRSAKCEIQMIMDYLDQTNPEWRLGPNVQTVIRTLSIQQVEHRRHVSPRQRSVWACTLFEAESRFAYGALWVSIVVTNEPSSSETMGRYLTNSIVVCSP